MIISDIHDNSPASSLKRLGIFAVVISVIAFAALSDDMHRLPIIFIPLDAILTFIGMYLGERFIQFIHPSYITAHGAMNAFYQRIFWLIGPQTIGAIIATLIAFSLVSE